MNAVDPTGLDKVSIRVHLGDANDTGFVGHVWIVIFRDNGQVETIEIGPHGAFFGGGRKDDIVINQDGTASRPFDEEITMEFDGSAYPTAQSIVKRIQNHDYDALYNNCGDVATSIFLMLTGINMRLGTYGLDSGPILGHGERPWEVYYAILLYKAVGSKRKSIRPGRLVPKMIKKTPFPRSSTSLR